jgi:hypothetical protein
MIVYQGGIHPLVAAELSGAGFGNRSEVRFYGAESQAGVQAHEKYYGVRARSVVIIWRKFNMLLTLTDRPNE